jgi:aromatic-L-amino-acid decarboxylase
MSPGLDPSTDQMRAMARSATDFVISFIHDLPEAPASDTDEGAELAARLAEKIAPEHGASFEELLEIIAEGAAKAVNNAGPGFLAYIPGGGLFATALADLVADSVDRYATMWAMAPGLVQLEYNVIRWLCTLFDYPDEARGILTSGGSMANFEAVVTARRTRLGDDFSSATIYVSEYVHHSLVKGAVLAGFPQANVRKVPCTPELRMDPGAASEYISRDRANGMHPFLLVASAGTADTGAVDPIDDLADVAGAEELWLHVDGAYGGFFHMTERGRALFRGIERADSITVDPHKGMFLPYGTGALIVKDGAAMRAAHYIGASYLQDIPEEDTIPNFSEYSIELSRGFRGLRVWLPIKLHGLATFRSLLDEKLDLAGFMYQELAETPGFELPWQPELTVVPFRFAPRDGDPQAFNRRLLERINASKRVFLSSTTINGSFMLRPCIVNHRTHRDRIEEAVQIIRAATADLDS